MDPKRRAAEAALKYVRDGMILGIGTGSTANEFIDLLGAALSDGRIKNIRGIASSVRSEHRAAAAGIPTTTLAQCPRIDLTVDGADEVDPKLNLIKGLGGALLREKIVAQASSRLLIIVDASKRVSLLGTRSPLPVEVVQFAHEAQIEFLKSLGCTPMVRQGLDGPYVTDNGNLIVDCWFADGIADPTSLERRLAGRAGIVDSGLFLDMADVVIVGDEQAAQIITRDKDGHAGPHQALRATS